jgi:hypothetical protein
MPPTTRGYFDDEPIILTLGSIASGTSRRRREFHCRFVRAGRIKAAGGRPGSLIIEPQALSSAWDKGMFDGKAVFIDHAGFFEYPSLKNLVGVTLDSSYNALEQSIEGTIKFYSEAQAIANMLDEILGDSATRRIDEAPVPDIGLSMVFYPVFAPRDSHPSQDQPG